MIEELREDFKLHWNLTITKHGEISQAYCVLSEERAG